MINREMPNRKRAFSLAEMVTVIGVIGVISAIALPNMTKVNQTAREATAKRNAQHLASIFMSAQEAGLDFADSSGDIDATIANVVSGGLVDGGAFDGSFFGLPSMAHQDQAEAKKYLIVDGGMLQYCSESSNHTISGHDPGSLPSAELIDYPRLNPLESETAGDEVFSPETAPLVDPIQTSSKPERDIDPSPTYSSRTSRN